MPKNIEGQRERRKGAFLSTWIATGWILFYAAVMLSLRHIYLRGSFWGAVLLIISILELGMLIPVWINLHTRLKEIEGGEEDAAAQY